MPVDPLFLLVGLALLLVVVVLLLGVGNFARGGDARKSNKLMQWRVAAQFGAVVLIVLFVLLRKGG